MTVPLYRGRKYIPSIREQICTIVVAKEQDSDDEQIDKE